MNGSHKLLLIINNEGQAAALKFPAAFPYPETKTVVNPRSKEEAIYYKTDRTKQIDGQSALIYTVANFRLDIDKFADGTLQEPTLETESKESSPELKIQQLQELLFDQIEYYKELKAKQDTGEVSDDFIYDTLYERFEYLGREDYLKIVQILA